MPYRESIKGRDAAGQGGAAGSASMAAGRGREGRQSGPAKVKSLNVQNEIRRQAGSGEGQFRDVA